jgi:hypothetical protein
MYTSQGQVYSQETNPASRQRGCYTRIMTLRAQLQKKTSGHEPQEAWRQD